MKRKMARQIIPKIILAVLLVGCASAPPAVQRVEIPIFTPCVKVVPKWPVYEFDQLAPGATDGEIVLALARDWPRGRKYEGELEAIIEGCLSVASPPSLQVLDLPPRPVPVAPK
jgi:hypothetical protein